MKKTLISISVILILCLIIVPMVFVPGRADGTVNVSTADQLREALQKEGDFVISVSGDIDYKLPDDFKWTNYDTENKLFIWAQIGSGKKILELNGHKINIDDDFVKDVYYTDETRYNAETGKSYETRVMRQTNFVKDAALIRVSAGASLTINGQGGRIGMTAQLPPINKMETSKIIMTRDLFDVDGGELVLNGGKYVAGRRKEVYTSKRAFKLTFGTQWKISGAVGAAMFIGNADNVINGTVLSVHSGSSAVNSCEFEGFGIIMDSGNEGRFIRNAVVKADGGRLAVYDGKFTAHDFADVFSISGKASASVYSGAFYADAPDWMYVANGVPTIDILAAGVTSGDPGSTVPKNAVSFDKSSMTTVGDSTIIEPVSAGTEGKLTWDDGSEEERTYYIGGDMTVKYPYSQLYFPEEVNGEHHYFTHEWALLVQKKDGKWTQVTDGWITRQGEKINLRSLTDNYTDGYTYSVAARFVEHWEGTHKYVIRTSAPKRLYFTVKSDKVIQSVTVDGFSGSLASVGPNTLTSKTQGVKSVSSVWYENGNAHTDTIAVKNGTYQANITLIAGDGYVFSSDTKVSTYGMSVTPSFISSDGKLIQALSPVINKVCDHSGSTSEWTNDTVYHYKYCSICGKTEQAEKHKYGNGVSSGNLTTYTCTVCGYEKTVQNGKEAISAVLLDMPALTVGSTLGAPKAADDFADKTSVASYQWYKGRGTSTKVSVGTKAESGWYTLEVSLNAKSGYYFKSNAFVTHSHGTKAGANAKDTSLTGTVYVYCSEKADLSVVIYKLSPDKTLGDVIKEIKVSRSGDERINVNYYVTVEGQKYSVKRSFDGKYTLGGGASTLEQLFAKKIVPDTEYEIEIEASAGSYYIDPENVSVDSRSYLIGYTSESNDTWVTAKATVLSDTDVIGLIELYGIKAPVTGAAPNKEFNLYDSERIKVTDATWGTSSAFKCNTAYKFTAKVKAADGYRFDGKTSALINGVEGKISVSGSTAEVSLTFPATEHKYGAWVTTEPTCEDPGHTKRTCSVCGNVESNEIPPAGHDFYFVDEVPSTCATQGIAGHYLCHACTMCFDADKNEKTEDAMRLPLDKNNHEGGPLQCDGGSHYVLCACGEKLNAEKHVFGDWAVIAAATEEEEGLKSRECLECGYSESEAIPKVQPGHEHKYSDKHDAGFHWKECECGDMTDKEAHTFDDKGVCTVCGYDKNVSEGDPSGKPGKTDPGAGSNVLPIILIVVGSLILIGAAVCIAVLIIRLNKAKKNPKTPEAK